MILEFLHNHLVGQNILLITMLLYFVTVLLRVDNHGNANLLYPIKEIAFYFSSSAKTVAKACATIVYVILIFLLIYENRVSPVIGIMDVYWIAVIIAYNISVLAYWIIANIETNKVKIFLALTLIILIEVVLLFVFKSTWHFK